LQRENNIQYIIPDEIFERVAGSFGKFASSINLQDARIAAKDHLNIDKSFKRAEILKRYIELKGKKVLEIGSGCGTNMLAWIKSFNTNHYGVEPGSEGFESGYSISLDLLRANNIDASRVINCSGEKLPFSDGSFDIVYSANVLEHTENPVSVLYESIRVLKKEGILHFEMPNYLSYFEGHYMVFQPPIVWKWLLPLWVQVIFRRDPAFAKTLRTEINPLWCKRTIKKLNDQFPIKLLSLGEDIFRENLRNSYKFETEIVSAKLKKIMRIVNFFNRNDLISNLLININGYYPIYLTILKK
jgi:ubiquinone/menaquinone biosynthesis C-methylase UbiE